MKTYCKPYSKFINQRYSLQSNIFRINHKVPPPPLPAAACRGIGGRNAGYDGGGYSGGGERVDGVSRLRCN